MVIKSSNRNVIKFGKNGINVSSSFQINHKKGHRGNAA